MGLKTVGPLDWINNWQSRQNSGLSAITCLSTHNSSILNHRHFVLLEKESITVIFNRWISDSMKIDVIATIIKREMLEIFIHQVMEWFFSANQIFLVAYCQLYITSRFLWPPSFGIIAEAARSEVAMVHNIIKLVHPRLMPTKLSRRWGIIVPAFGVFCSVKIVCIVHKCVMKSITSTRTWGETSVFFHLTVLWRVLLKAF